MSEKAMNGAELKEFHERVRVETLRQLDQIKLRQWCVEQAMKTVASIEDTQNLTQYFYNFVTDKETPHAKSS